jgi:glutathione S-transferase
MKLPRLLDVGSAWLSGTVLRFGAGLEAAHLGRRPQQPLELYEFEACPFCRRVREMLSMLDLPAIIRPCPKGGTRHRPEVVRRGGKAQFPYLIDPNTGRALYESKEIVAYLADTYGDGTRPMLDGLPAVDAASAALAFAARPTRSQARPGRLPEKMLELWSFEASPYCRLVREALCELELPYVLHNVAKKSPSRPAFVARSGRMMVPYLADANTGKEMFESADIVRYLERTYGSGAATS